MPGQVLTGQALRPGTPLQRKPIIDAQLQPQNPTPFRKAVNDALQEMQKTTANNLKPVALTSPGAKSDNQSKGPSPRPRPAPSPMEQLIALRMGRTIGKREEDEEEEQQKKKRKKAQQVAMAQPIMMSQQAKQGEFSAQAIAQALLIQTQQNNQAALNNQKMTQENLQNLSIQEDSAETETRQNNTKIIEEEAVEKEAEDEEEVEDEITEAEMETEQYDPVNFSNKGTEEGEAADESMDASMMENPQPSPNP